MTGNIEGDAKQPFSAGQLPNHNCASIGKKTLAKITSLVAPCQADV